MLEKVEIYRTKDGTVVKKEDFSEIHKSPIKLLKYFALYLLGDETKKIEFDITYINGLIKDRKENEFFTMLDSKTYIYVFNEIQFNAIVEKEYLNQWLNENLYDLTKRLKEKGLC